MSKDNKELDEMDFDLLDILGVTEQKVESITLLPGYNKNSSLLAKFFNDEKLTFASKKL